ncbi:MAG: DUF4169 family protein [Proteobacteria bacterium]|nr:DUF4169 family protein [Pseudomonadota bacterium]
MAEIINLRQARKTKARDEKRAAGDENAARHGRSKALKALEKARNDRAEAALDAHRLDGRGE